MAGDAKLAAELPPLLDGLDPTWSRLVPFVDTSGVERTAHVLDVNPEAVALTVLCVHGNPSWSYLWRLVAAQAPADVRVVAPDHLNMGYSERTGSVRRLADRIDDLGAIVDAMQIKGPVVTLAHDWGGPISLGWAERNTDRLSGFVLANTAVSQPPDTTPPRLITTAGSKRLLRAVTERSPAFIRGGLRLSNPEPPAKVRAGYLAPYQTAARRTGVRDFVADIPLESDHVTYPTLEAVADGLESLQDLPSLLLWGIDDPVFSEKYLHDLESRLPKANVHRFASASHFVTEDAPAAEAFWAWIQSTQRGDSLPSRATPELNRPLLPPSSGLASPLVVESHDDGWRSIEPDLFLQRVDRVSRGLLSIGAQPGDRVALLIPPGINLNVVLYACWQAGLTAMLVDSGLGVRNMNRAVRAGSPDWLIGIPPAMVASKALRWNGRRIVVGEMDSRIRSALGVERSMREIEFAGETAPELIDLDHSDDPAILVFTSGSTGPSKGVRYRTGHLGAQRDAIVEMYGITPNDRLVAAFAPFALYGPAMGITSVVPDMDVAKPGSLTATALAQAAQQVDATMIFASPSALQNVIDSANEMTAGQRESLQRVRLVLSAGAPVQLELLQAVAHLCPSAEIHTPYGMTEILPVADVSLAVRLARGDGPGVCVGQPFPGVSVRIHPLDALGMPSNEPSDDPDVLGEVVVSGAHVKESYDRLWWTEHRSRTADGWHRTGDIGSLDAHGMLWISGRVQHVITGPSGPIAPVPIEHVAERVAGVKRAAAVGVGPLGGQAVVVVLEVSDPGRDPLVPSELAAEVRAALVAEGLSNPVAVLDTAVLPVDKRHNSKINRTRVAQWADDILAGGRPGRL